MSTSTRLLEKVRCHIRDETIPKHVAGGTGEMIRPLPRRATAHGSHSGALLIAALLLAPFTARDDGALDASLNPKP